ncbi:MAG: ATP-binding cassette domain-containing protein [Candidatus Scalindua sp. AMX11]|nr:MAG: ATP-binding cassette domain-containing protein [Candidatus Scalindua sp.]NOG83551.1 ATP-binding cassette domain-containing protein [Planctomycetota bacterium]RZV70944.1 MAG: ATP-binding cassette domain-containing protein [Candidatus Scalindua sp. SCAELEC01]TDE64251.1 MAG: ATP-binding cassette domain-containing protein [Candidatus Scalindua sp. AMX11]GJQ59955.1 MAG: ABC transporter ATP-binding protein [Candidatus Scalindua sp.]
MITIEGVSKTYGKTTALHSIDLTIPTGQTTVFIGQSGCGKSTILRLIIGLIQAECGSVFFEGTRVTPETAISLRRKMGYVIQEGGLFPHLTAYGNVALMARYLGWSEERIKERLNVLTELTHFPSEGLKRFPVQLSGGQQQRVSLMRALMLDPDVLLLDEPLGALDPMIRADLQVDLKAIFQTLGKTVVLVTHDIAEAGFFGDVITLLRDGRVLQKGTLEELVQSPADPFVTRFINAQRSPLDSMKKDLG